MNPDCHHLHPDTPSIPFSHPPSQSCLPCALCRLSDSSVLPTIRRASCATFLLLASSPQQLLRRAAHFAPDLILALLTTYFSLHPTNDPDLCADLRRALSALAIAFDTNVVPAPSCYPYIHSVVTRIADAALQGDDHLTTLAAQLFAAVVSTARTANNLRLGSTVTAIHDALSGRPEFLPALLALLPASEQVFRDVSLATTVVLSVVEPSQVDLAQLLQLVERCMPPHRMPEADAMYMGIVSELVCRTIDVHSGAVEPAWDVAHIGQVLMESRVVLDVLKNSVLSEETDVRSVATRVVCALCRNGGFAEQMCTHNVFDYIIESIRSASKSENELSAEKKNLLFLSIESIDAIARPEPESLPDKWCYCLDVVLGVTTHLFEGIHARRVSRIVGHAFRLAPIPMFTSDILDQFVSFQMTRMTCEDPELSNEKRSNEMENIESDDHMSCLLPLLQTEMGYWSKLLERRRCSISSINSILHVCEALIQRNTSILGVAPVLGQLLKEFIIIYKAFASDDEGDANGPDVNAHQCIGQRLLFLVYDSFARMLEDSLKGSEKRLEDIFSIEELVCLLEMLTAALDPVFLDCGSCSEKDQLGMRCWCWRTCPPRAMFKTYSRCENELIGTDVVDLERWKNAVQMYLLRITGILEADHHDVLDLAPLTEEVFIEGISTDLSSTSSSWLLLWEAMTIGEVSSLGGPETIVDALCLRLQKLFQNCQSRLTTHCLNVLRVVSFICDRHEMSFDMMAGFMDVLTSLVRHVDFSMSNSSDFIVFQNAIGWEPQGMIPVHLWNKFVAYSRTFMDAYPVEIDTFWRSALQQHTAIKSVVFALERSAAPGDLITCLLSLSTTLRSTSKLVTCCLQAGILDLLRDLLRKLKLPLQAGGERELTNNEVERERASAILVLLSMGSSTSINSHLDWNILRECCELLVHESKSNSFNASSWLLLSSIIRWLLVCLQTNEKQNVANYFYQCGVLNASIRTLRSCRSGSFLSDQFSSMTACFILLLMRNFPHIVDFIRQDLANLLEDRATWVGLLNSCSGACLQDSTYKVTNCSYLLRALMAEKSLVDCTFSPSREVITCLAIASCSVDQIVSCAALRALQSIMDTTKTDFSEESSSACHLRLSRQLLNKAHHSNFATVTEHEARYLASAVTCGHLRTDLNVLRTSMQIWIEAVETKQCETGTDYLSKHHQTAFLFLATTIDSILMHEASSRTSLASRIRNKLETSTHDVTAHPPTRMHPPQIIFATYSVLWAIG